MVSNSFKKNFIWNVIGTTLNSFNSMFFMIAITRINGEDEAGIYTLLFAVACLLYNIGIYYGRTFQVTDQSKEVSDTEYVIHRSITCGIMLVVGVVYCLFKGLNFYRFALTMALTLMKCLEAWSDILYGIEQKNDELYKSGISYSIKAIGSLVGIIVVDAITHNLVLSFLIVDVFCAIITIAYDIPSTKKYLKKKYDMHNVMMLFKTGFFAFAFFFLSVFYSNATKYALDGRVTSAEQAKYSIILMPATLISLCAVYLLQPYINQLSTMYSKNDKQSFRATSKKIAVGIIGIGVLAIIVACTFAIPVLNLIYAVDLNAYKTPLLIIVIGAIFSALNSILSTALTVFRNMKVQFYIYLAVSISIYFITCLFVDDFGILGASISYLIGILLQVGMYYIAYRKELSKWKGLAE